ncbi:MAG TPA: ABC transporter ATP-binding protein [Stellaceae bacterium]|nr:ABC transporter ATP-binding protein [Stellaceae bacterium]
MIELRGVTKRYGARASVNDVSFAVAEGAFCALVGPSGSGKSTTLRMINRLIEPSAGTIRLGGEDVATIPVESLRRRIGYAIQSVGLFPHWTIADNIATVPRLLKWPEDRVRARIEELLTLVRLDPGAVRAKYPHQLSGGQQQRIGVARALAADPDVLLMDEPFGALDPITREALRLELARIHKATGKTILFVTHDVDEALQMADAIAIMRDGRLVQFGTPSDLLTKPADDFVRDFMGGSALGLKLLALERVADRLNPETVPGEAPLALDARLSEALSQMVLRRADRLPVSDDAGKPVGSIALRDLVARS